LTKLNILENLETDLPAKVLRLLRTIPQHSQ
jgi:hypothetical protein